MTGYLDLDRQFMHFRDEESWELQYLSFFSEEFYGCERWTDLLTHKRTVILAEAGAGKTAEMREKTKVLIQGGSSAFYVTVNSLATTPFRDALVSSEDQVRFDKWLAGCEEGVFFIDSVDEARLSGKNFRDALSHLAKALAGYAMRSTILISCRVSDWRATQDRIGFEELLGKPPGVQSAPLFSPGGDDEALYAPIFSDTRQSDESNEKKSSPPSYKPYITALAPLTIKQAKRLTEFDGVTKPEEFIIAVQNADAENLVNRPQDLLNLTRLWKDKKTIGSKYTILKWSIQQRLSEPNLDLSHKDTLSAEQALKGARLIAAALTLGQKRFIAWPLDTPTGSVNDCSLDPKDALPDWSGQLQQTLLNRAVFDPASHGRIRFYHRSAQELLCAEWIVELMKVGCPIRRIWALLAEKKYGGVRLRPAMRPVAAWLAQLDERIRDLVMPISPDLLVEDGDPALLPTLARECLLAQFAKTYHRRDDAGIRIDINQIARLASPRLAGKIRALWEEAYDSGELRELLLRIIWIGKVESCGDIALAVTIGRGCYYERALGARALGEIGTFDQRQTLSNYLLKYARSYPKKAIAEALQAVFPSVLSLANLDTLIRKHPLDNMKSSHSGLIYGLSEIALYAELPNPDRLADLLYKLVTEKPWFDRHHQTYSKRFYSLCVPLTNLCTRLIREAGEKPVNNQIVEISQFVCHMSNYFSDFQIIETAKDLKNAISENTGANRQQFWLAVENERAEQGDLVGCFGALWRLRKNDFEWLLADLKTKTLVYDKTVALSGLLALWNDSGENADQLQAIRDVILNNKELEDQLDRILNPHEPEKNKEESKYKKLMAERESNRKKKHLVIKESWKVFRDRLVAEPDKLKDGTEVDDLVKLAWWIKKSTQRDSTSDGDWQTLVQPFSPEVAQAARLGFAAYWRTCDIGIERARKNKTIGEVLPALIGLAIESVEMPNFLDNCKENDVVRATHLAFYEMNGISDWALNLWVTFPQNAGPILRAEIRWEFDLKLEHDLVHHVVSKLVHTKEPFRSLAADWVLSELETKLPGNDYTLSCALDIIIGAMQDFSNRLVALSSTKFGSERSNARRLVWLSVWLGVDADHAVDALEGWIRKQKTISDQDLLVMRLLNIMFDSGVYQFGAVYRDFTRFDPLIRLIQIAYAHVRREDDKEHERAYSPDERDDAEHARSNLVGILIDTPGESTYRALKAMSEMPIYSISSERFRVLADRRATMDADIEPWMPADIVDFTKTYEKFPVTLEGLHDVVLHRLWDIEDDMRVGRFSNKAVLRQDHLKRAKERSVQLGIADQLRLRSNGVYSLEREPELESFDEPDISIQRAGIDEPLPVEIKVADSWSYPQLSAAISGQLVGQYMKPRNATHGLLVITYHGKKKYWRPGNGRPTCDFHKLVRALQNEADDLSKTDRQLTQVSVTGIDLTDSSPSTDEG